MAVVRHTRARDRVAVAYVTVPAASNGARWVRRHSWGLASVEEDDPGPSKSRPSGAPSPGRGGPRAAGDGRRVLVVEDYENTRDVYRAILVYGGYQVSTAEDGEEAVRVARRDLPDLIVMDINLPVLSGWDAARMLKGSSATKDIIIIGISANTSPESHRMAEELGFHAYYTKPFAPRMVLAAVHGAFGLSGDS